MITTVRHEPKVAERNPLWGGQATMPAVNVREAQATLMRAEAQYALVAPVNPDVVLFMVDTLGRVASWNENASRITGFSRDEILFQPVSLIYSPEEIRLGVIKQDFERAGERSRYERDAWRLRKDRSRLWARCNIVSVRRESGELAGYTYILRDLSPVQLTEAPVQGADEALLSRAIWNANDAMLSCTSNGVISTWNRAAETLFGFSAVEAVGKNLSMLLPEGSDGSDFLASIEGDKTADEPLVLWMRKDGTPVELSLNVSAVRNGYKRTTGLFVIARDVSQRAPAFLAHKSSTTPRVLKATVSAISDALAGILEGSHGGDGALDASLTDVLNASRRLSKLLDRAFRDEATSADSETIEASDLQEILKRVAGLSQERKAS